MSRFGNSKGEDEKDDDEEYDKNVTTSVFSTYGWTVLDLFNFKNDLKRGTYKLPLYKPPTIINLDVRDIS
jgi:hypothetical protein